MKCRHFLPTGNRHACVSMSAWWYASSSSCWGVPVWVLWHTEINLKKMSKRDLDTASHLASISLLMRDKMAFQAPVGERASSASSGRSSATMRKVGAGQYRPPSPRIVQVCMHSWSSSTCARKRPVTHHACSALPNSGFIGPTWALDRPTCRV
jgi:hypothetical protein